MGSRANYIIKKGESIEIRYTHWRANYLAQDLFMGIDAFLDFANQFEEKNELISDPWMEACALIDEDKKVLLFWESELARITSIRKVYLSQLKARWPQWELRYVEHEMLDIDQYLNIDYCSQQDKDFDYLDFHKLNATERKDYVSCYVIIKRSDELQCKKLYRGSNEQVALLGEKVLSFIKNIPGERLLKEEELDSHKILLIDLDDKHLIVNQYVNALAEELMKVWPAWKIEVGNFGYIHALEKMGVDTQNLKMPLDEAREALNEILSYSDDYNPKQMAENIVAKEENVQFHPNFFEDIKPKKSIGEKIKRFFKPKK